MASMAPDVCASRRFRSFFRVLCLDDGFLMYELTSKMAVERRKCGVEPWKNRGVPNKQRANILEYSVSWNITVNSYTWGYSGGINHEKLL